MNDTSELPAIAEPWFLSELPAIAEPWFLAFNAKFTARPAMVAEDLAKAQPAIEAAVKDFG